MRSTPSPRAARARRALATIAAGSAAILLTGCMLFARPPQDLDYSRTRTSSNGLYRATIRPVGDTIPQGKLHRWTLHLETVDGTPVDLCDVKVDGGMPQHGHGLPTAPVVTAALGDGRYRIEGVRFNMSGWWVLKIGVKAAPGADSAEFNLVL